MPNEIILSLLALSTTANALALFFVWLWMRRHLALHRLLTPSLDEAIEGMTEYFRQKDAAHA